MRVLAQRLHKALHPAPARDDAPRSGGERALLLIGSFGGVGYLPASGTVSVALVGIPLFLLLAQLPPAAYLVFVSAFTLASVWLHEAGDKVLGEHDSGKLVWDEQAGFWIAMALLPAVTWQLVVLGFLLERGLDILKPWPAGALERRAPGGWGVVLDDVVAGLYARLLLGVACVAAPGWLGLAP